MSPKGRPTDDPKTHETRIRMSDEDIRMLTFCSEKLQKSKAEIIRQGIRAVYESLQ